MTQTIKHLHEVAQPIFVAEVYIFYEDSLLMFKRSETKKKFPGFWSIPGGHIDEGQDPLAAAIREVKEETGLTIESRNITLKYIALHNHLDRHEMYVAFAFAVNLTEEPKPLVGNEEGMPHWIKRSEVMSIENVFPPIKYYFKRILNDEPGIVYNNSEWRNNQLVRVLSETIDANG